MSPASGCDSTSPLKHTAVFSFSFLYPPIFGIFLRAIEFKYKIRKRQNRWETIVWKIREILSTKITMDSSLASRLRFVRKTKHPPDKKKKKKQKGSQKDHLVISKVYEVFKTENS